MSVSFGDWVNNGWLVAHKSGKQEIGNLLGIVARDLKDSQRRTRRTIGASPSLTTRECKDGGTCCPQVIGRRGITIMTALFSRWNSPWEKTRSSFAPLTHSAGRET
jgi:hypothetical protein